MAGKLAVVQMQRVCGQASGCKESRVRRRSADAQKILCRVSPTHSFNPGCCHAADLRIASSSCCWISAILCSSRSSSLASASLMLLRSGGEVHIDCRGPRSAKEALREEVDNADEEEEIVSGAWLNESARGEAGGEDEEEGAAAVEAVEPAGADQRSRILPCARAREREV